MSAALVVPVITPLLTGVSLLGLTGREPLQRALSLGSGAAVLAASGAIAGRAARGDVLVLRLGGWDPRVGVVWVADALTGAMLVLAAIASLATVVYAPASLRGPGESRYFYPLHHLLLTGVNGAFVTGDYFNLFVFFEVMLLASFALIALGARGIQLERAFPYVIVNLVASLLFLGGVGAVYGTAGTVNMAELARRAAAGALPGAFWAAAALVLVVFAVKAALAPVFTWLPDAYPEAPIAVNAAFSGLLTKVGVYALFRSVTLFSGHAPPALAPALLVAAGATMIIGVVGALGRDTIRGVLSFHIVSQIGYMAFGLALLTPRALAAGLFFVAHQIPAKMALFLAGGVAERVGGSGALGDVRGMARTHPWVAAGFFVPALSLAGVPPFSGFWGKLLLLVEGYRGGAGARAVATIALLVSFLTLASMLKIWVAVFWGAPQGQRAPALGRDAGMVAATLALASLSVAIGLLAPPLHAYAERAAAQLLDPAPYLDAVLGRAAAPAGSAP
ncbi:proton-conducting transporter transmembrane domain-containing protein [Sorangium sp. So ce1024]|uniref:proton-conducting transporter transmembrane domain-containing protein n=1 Tax=Sorangium sp. So ce1024 TaxID=3133327 RepID=UPI003F0CDBDD